MINSKILHLGFFKTGTTFMQELLFPIIGKELSISYISRSNAYGNDKLVRHINDASDILDDIKEHNFMFSDEWFLMIDNHDKLFRLLLNYTDLKYIISIRKQDDLFRSRYISRLNTAYYFGYLSIHFNKLITDGELNSSLVEYLDYDFIFKKFKENRLNIHYIVYEQLFDNPEYEIKRLINFCGDFTSLEIEKMTKNVIFCFVGLGWKEFL